METVDESPAKLSIPEWSKADRPRERMLANGPKAMSDAELVAILIRSGTPKDSALDLARAILKQGRRTTCTSWRRSGVSDLSDEGQRCG